MNLERLRLLHAVATEGSVAKAAATLVVTPSAASQQLAKLEKETGQRLLARDGRGVRLTDAGHRLVDHAKRILALVEEARADLEEHRGRVYGTLAVASFATAARGLLPEVMARMAARHPELCVELREQDPGESIPAVARGAVDVALVQDWATEPLVVPNGLATTALFDDQVDVALPAEHPSAGREQIDLDEVAGQRWISWPSGSICHAWLLHTLRSRGVEPLIAHTVAEHSTQLALVAAGQGIGIIPRLGRGRLPGGVRVVPVRPALSRRVHVVWRTGAGRRPAIRAVLDVLTTTPPG
ncbi:LysR family transcriptional regulator [Saccharopolyspora gregorii]|uniref:LysR family transcriptional regulator n=1 Tax=Saccharopolyspora gregorii TaxID=33914 RepID=UPI0021AC3B93|nr:LysR family transcriptional regulator [Saccharopolyspora gregorii]